MGVNAARKYVAVAVGHMVHGYHTHLWFWGNLTDDVDKRCFGGYTTHADKAERYTLEEFAEKYPFAWVETSGTASFCKSPSAFLRKYKDYGVVLLDVEGASRLEAAIRSLKKWSCPAIKAVE